MISQDAFVLTALLTAQKESAGRGVEQAADKKKSRTKASKAPKKLFEMGDNLNFVAVEAAAEEWRKKKAGLTAYPGSVDWEHDRVHVLLHSFLGGPEKVGEWFGLGSWSPTPAEEVLVNLLHRSASLKGLGDSPNLTDMDLKRYISRDIQVLDRRNNIKVKDRGKYMVTEEDGYERSDWDKFITKYREMEKTPGFNKLLDAAYKSFTNAGELFL